MTTLAAVNAKFGVPNAKTFEVVTVDAHQRQEARSGRRR